MSQRSLPLSSLAWILLCFFLSGAAGLIYQVAWVKSLGLIFGHTAYAIAIVLAVFMAGLTAGSAWFGRWAARRDAPILLYARVEFLVAATGALSLAGLAAVRQLYDLAYPSVTDLQPLVAGLRFAGAAAVLFLPTALMGGTLPILVRAVARNSSDLGSRVSQLYWVNTLGAVAGTLLAGFYLLPALGLRLTVACAVLLNVAAGLIGLLLFRGAGSRAHPPQEQARSREAHLASREQRLPHPRQNLFLSLFALVGATAFAYEIAWTRLLSITISSSTYAFTLMLATFLLGTVAGSALFARFVGRGRSVSITTFSGTQTWTAFAALASLALFHWTPAIIPPLLRVTHESFGGLLLAQFLTSALAVLPVAAVFGFNFPAVIVLVSREAESSSGDMPSAAVGRAYAANTAGAIFGSLVTGFCLVPWLGAFRVIAAAAGVNLLLASVLKLRQGGRKLLPLLVNAALIAGAALIAASSFFNNPSLLSLSAVLYGNSYQGLLNLPDVAATNELVFAADGANDSVAVFRSDNYVALRINGKVDASTGDARTQLLLGHLGAAFDPAPKRVLIIGFGGGMTASAVARYPGVERIDCVEIEPVVLRAAPYLATLNRGVLNDPRLHLHFDDARTFLLTSRQKYDLIISEPSNPWIAGIATLFTTEFYAAVRDRLNPGGKFVQWVQSYSLAPADLRMIIATLVPHFPEVTLWRGEGPDLLLLARTESAPLDFTRLRQLWTNPVLRDDFAAMAVHEPTGLAAYFLLDDGELRHLAQGSALNTDDRTLLEYHAPETILRPDLSHDNHELIAQFRGGPLPATLAPYEIPRARQDAAATALDLGDLSNAEGLLNAIPTQPPSATRDLLAGRLAYLQGRLPEAKAALQFSLQQSPGQPEAMHWLATVEEKLNEHDAARALVDQILAQHPRYLPALTDELEFAAARNDYRIALLAQLNRLTLLPDPPASEYCRLAAIWMKLAEPKEAEPVLARGIAKDPYSYACNLELGELYRESHRYAEAREHLELVIRLYPNYDATTFRSLAGVDIILGDRRAAKAVLRKGARMFPNDTDLRQAASAM
jgi:spermidine synthase